MELTAEVVFVVLAALGAAVCVGAFAARLPAGEPVFESALRARPSSDRVPAQLVRVEQIVGWATASAMDVHTRLRPVLAEAATTRLARHGLRLDGDPAEVRRLLGPAAWDLLRPDRPVPADVAAPGLSARELGAVLDALEAL